MQGPPLLEKLGIEAIDFCCFHDPYTSGVPDDSTYGKSPIPHSCRILMYTKMRRLDSSFALRGMSASLKRLSSFSWLSSCVLLLRYSVSWTRHGSVTHYNMTLPLLFWSTVERVCANACHGNKSHCSLSRCAPLIARLLFHLHTQWRVYCLTTSSQLSLLLQILGQYLASITQSSSWFFKLWKPLRLQTNFSTDATFATFTFW